MEHGREAAALAESAGSEGRTALVWALTAQAHGERASGNYESEFEISKRVVQLHRDLGNIYLLGVALSTYSFSAMSLGKYDEARRMLDEALPLLRETGDPYRIAMALNFSGDLARCEHHYARAQRDYEQSISLLRDLEAVRDLASALHNLGHACLHRGAIERAHTLFRESLSLHQTQGNMPGMAECLIGFAALAIVGNEPALGVRLLAAAVAIGGEQVVSAWAATRMEHEHYLERARNNLTDEEFRAERENGRALSLEQAVGVAEALSPGLLAEQAAHKPLDDLTVREREVAALIAQGKSNEQIADELVIGKRTVEKHIANIRSKLGFTERTQIVRWAIETRLAHAADEISVSQ